MAEFRVFRVSLRRIKHVVAGLLTSSFLPSFAAAEGATFLDTPERRAVWAHMRADYESGVANLAATWYGDLRAKALSDNDYADIGLYGALMYRITGEQIYADKAWLELQDFLARPEVAGTAGLGGDFSREHGLPLVICYNYIKRALSPAQDTQFLNKLNAMATIVTTFPHGWRWNDTDQVLGDYFMLAALYATTHEDNPVIVQRWAVPQVGGFAQTALEGTPTNMRQAITFFVSKASGGEWISTPMYDSEVAKIMGLGVACVRSVLGYDPYPEIAAFLPSFGLRAIHSMTSDYRDAAQYGDTQDRRHPSNIPGRLFQRLESLMVTSGLLVGTPEGPYVQAHLMKLAGTYPPAQFRTAYPYARGYLLVDPYAPTADLARLPTISTAQGAGAVDARTSWASSGASFHSHWPPSPTDVPVDHLPRFFGEFRAYDGGEWWIDHPFGYANISSDGRASNQMMVAGHPYLTWGVHEFKELLGSLETADYVHVWGAEGGQVNEPTYYDRPPTFLHAHVRHLVWLKAERAVVVFDKVKADDPRTLPSPQLNRYAPPRLDYMQSRLALGLVEWRIHSRRMPTISSAARTIDYMTFDRNRPVRVTVLKPSTGPMDLVDERIEWEGGSGIAEEEKAWHVEVRSSQRYQTGLLVYQLEPTAAPEYVQDRTRQGVRVGRKTVWFDATEPPDLPNGEVAFDPSVPSILRAVGSFAFASEVEVEVAPR